MCLFPCTLNGSPKVTNQNVTYCCSRTCHAELTEVYIILLVYQYGDYCHQHGGTFTTVTSMEGPSLLSPVWRDLHYCHQYGGPSLLSPVWRDLHHCHQYGGTFTTVTSMVITPPPLPPPHTHTVYNLLSIVNHTTVLRCGLTWPY